MTQEATAIIYDSMYEYVKGADITHYEHSNADPDAPEILIEAFQPFDDPDFGIDWDNEVTHNGINYVKVWWGELETLYVKVSVLYEVCYVRYVLYSDPMSDYSTYIADGTVYETYEDAKYHNTKTGKQQS